MMQKVLDRGVMAWVFSLAFILAGCGGGTSWDDPDVVNSPNVNPPPLKFFVEDPHKEVALTSAPYNQGMGDAAYGGGRYLVAYADDRDNNSGLYGEDVWATLFDSNLGVVKEFPVYRHEGKDYGVKVIFDRFRNRFVVTWVSYGAKVSAKAGVMACFVSLDGVVSDPVTLPVSELAASNAVMRATQEGYVLLFLDTWASYDMGVGYTVLKFARVRQDLSVVDIKWVTDDTSAGVKVVPIGAVMDCSDDTCLFAYSMTKYIVGRGGEQIYARTINLDGVLGPELQVSDTNPSQAGSNNSPYVVYGGGRFLVTWLDPFWSRGTQLMGKFVSLGGVVGNAMVVSDFRADRTKPNSPALTGGVEGMAAAYRESDDTFHVFWVDSGGGVPLDGRVYYRKVNDGLADNPVVFVNDTPGYQKIVSVVVGGDNRLFVDWVSKGASGQDLFGILY